MADNARHDLGTDLWLMARDARGFDLQLLVGAQVKSGPSYFRERQSANGALPGGWWYRDRDGEHVAHWATHSVPHLLVLHDLTSRNSYWAHVTAEAVVSTGKGCKVLVPESQTIEGEHLAALLEVAGRGRGSTALEGTAWDGASVLPRDALRHALLVPRLVAPHPNAGLPDAGLSCPQATALLMQARRSAVMEAGERFDTVPTLSDMRTHADWGWRFVAALYDRLFLADLETLANVRMEAQTTWERTAATVVLAAAHLEMAQRSSTAKAVALVDEELAADDAGPVDHAWLRLQRARGLGQLGRLVEGRDEALEAHGVRAAARNDVTARAIGGTAASVVFDFGRAGANFGAAIREGDNAVSWWRTQTTLRGALAAQDRAVREWTGGQDVTFADGDPAQGQLSAAGASASHLGSHGAWRSLSARAASDLLVRTTRRTRSEDVAPILADLMSAGDDKTVKLALRRIVADGPAAAVRLAGAARPLRETTSGSIFGDLALVEHGGHLLAPADAEERAAWLAAALNDPEPFDALTWSRAFAPDQVIADCLMGLIEVIPHRVAEIASAHLRSADPRALGPLETDAWARVVATISDRGWAPEHAHGLTEVPLGGSQALDAAILGARAANEPAARGDLVARARGGDREALYGLGRLSDLPGDLAREWLDRLALELDDSIERARKGELPRGRHDPAELYATLMTHHGEGDNWRFEPLLAFLETEAVHEVHKRRALGILAHEFERFGELPQARLRGIVDAAAAAAEEASPWLFAGPPELGLLRYLRGRVGSPDEALACVLQLLAGTANDRAWAAALVGAREVEDGPGMLAVLVHDDDAVVRAAAVGATVALAVSGRATANLREGLAVAVQDAGCAVPRAALVTLRQIGDATDRNLLERLALLSDHPSAQIRGLLIEVAEAL